MTDSAKCADLKPARRFMSVSLRGRTLVTDGGGVQLPWPVVVAVEQEDKVLVLLDPLSYLSDPSTCE